ncbi:MAG: hypothetical protein IKQ18_03940, partial [Clostridia bacterium]|nr:hypothetical protein [Clostridia bacterium]
MNKKIISVLLLLSAAFILLCSCTQTKTDVPSGMKLASVDAADYYMYVPNEWIIADQDGVTSAYVSIADKSNVTCARYRITNEAVFDIPADRDENKADGVIYAENYWRGYTSELETHLPGYRLISGPTATLLNGSPAVRVRYISSVSGTDYNFDMVICVK